MPATPTDTQPATSAPRAPAGYHRVLCAYSPRWLSGPTPGYRGLCPTWEGDQPTTEQPAVSAR
jgi:hypothetical protein